MTLWNLHDTPIRRKLTIVISLSTFVALLSASAAFFVNDVYSYKDAQARSLRTISQIVGSNCTAALSFDDPAAAQEVLQAFLFRPAVIHSAVYDKSGRLFAGYGRAGETRTLPEAPGPDGHRFSREEFDLVTPILLSGQRIGTIYVKADLREIDQRFRHYAGITLAILAGSFLLSFAFSGGFQRMITAPILALSKVAAEVSEKKNYAIRAPKYGRDELGELTETFNQMLADIQKQSELLKQAHEDRFRNLAESANEAIVSTDADGRIVYANRGGERMFGYGPGEAVGRPLAALLPRRLDADDGGLAGLLASGGGGAGKTVELTGLRKNGEEFPLEISLSSWIESGETFFTAIIRDITERRRAEEALALKSSELERANRELEAFSYSVSHDLRAPLRHIDGFVDLLKKSSASKLGDAGLRQIGIISDSAKQMGALIDDLLVFSRMGRVEIKKVKLDVSQIVGEAVEGLSHEAAGRKVEWKIGALSQAEGDRALIKQVFMNLIGNALKYSRVREQAVIEVGRRPEKAEDVFFVKDNGAGFDMRYYEKLFGVFQRLHSAEEFEGTGIGLANVQRIVQRHGGRVWAEGAVDAGAVFYFSLPKS